MRFNTSSRLLCAIIAFLHIVTSAPVLVYANSQPVADVQGVQQIEEVWKLDASKIASLMRSYVMTYAADNTDGASLAVIEALIKISLQPYQISVKIENLGTNLIKFGFTSTNKPGSFFNLQCQYDPQSGTYAYSVNGSNDILSQLGESSLARLSGDDPLFWYRVHSYILLIMILWGFYQAIRCGCSVPPGGRLVKACPSFLRGDDRCTNATCTYKDEDNEEHDLHCQ